MHAPRRPHFFDPISRCSSITMLESLAWTTRQSSSSGAAASIATSMLRRRESRGASFGRPPPVLVAVLVAVIVPAIYMASMARTGLWDPWETHYGEVARQILVRNDPIDLHWHGGNGGVDARSETTFWSKPALPFWLMALSMKVFGVGTSADPGELVRGYWPELALRLPSLIAGLGCAGFLGWVVWRLASPRAGVLTVIVLCTMPQWALASRQALTDMFFVAPTVVAMGSWAMAWLQPDRPLRTRGDGWKSVPWDRATLLFVVALVLAVAVPLAVVHQYSFDPGTWRRVGHVKALTRGLREIQVQMVVYWALLAIVLVRSTRWRRRSQVWMGVLYIAAGTSLMGKGMIGPGLIGLVVLVHLGVTKRWKLLLVCGLPTGVLLFALAGFPWHHAMLLYRGEKFFSEFVVVNNLQRFATGEQEQAIGGFTYYLRTLGLATFPWAGLVPLLFWAGAREFGRASPGADDVGPPKTSERTERSALFRFVFVWGLVCLFAVSYSATKYYHYLLPCLPPLAAMLAIWLDELVTARTPRTRVGVHIGLIFGAVVMYGVLRDLQATPEWLAHLTTYKYDEIWITGGPDVSLAWWTSIPFVLGLAALATGRGRAGVLALVVSATMTTTWVIDVYLPAASENWSQRSMMRVYFENRAPGDRLVSWALYHRGETFFAKADIHVIRKQDPKRLRDFVNSYAAEHAGEGASVWIATLAPVAKHSHRALPAELRSSDEVVYESFHYALIRVRLP